MARIAKTFRPWAATAALFAFCAIGWLAATVLAQAPGDPETKPALQEISPQPSGPIIAAPVELPVPKVETEKVAAPVIDDPEKEARAFAEQNEKVAEAKLKALKAEEARLRARLERVEGGIKRWESLLGAIKQSQGGVVVPGNVQGWKHRGKAIVKDEPTYLEPTEPAPAPIVAEPKR